LLEVFDKGPEEQDKGLADVVKQAGHQCYDVVGRWDQGQVELSDLRGWEEVERSGR
jgi:hypothetical protein